MPLRLLFGKKTAELEPDDMPRQKRIYRPVPRIVREEFEPADPLRLDTDELHRQFQLERYAYIVMNRHQWKNHPDIDTIYRACMASIDEAFALVPEGFVSLPQTINDDPGTPELDFETEPFLLARCCVTNAQYQKFVDSGGYQDLSLWPEEIWPQMIEFHDQTGQPGPRFWHGGRHHRRLSDHPVVGICYFEAAAYAKWAGYRLPTEPEWQMAASWRIRSSAQVMRRYPWGDALDTRKCNIWASGIGQTVPVHHYPEGAAPNGVLQLVGNVWEWTTTDFEMQHEGDRQIVGDMLLKSIRGGAFDTYFPVQATSTFRTGLTALSRVYNVGFRCAIDLASLGD